MIKYVLIGAGILIVVAVLVVFLFKTLVMDKPMYRPGMVKAGKNLRSALDPPPQDGVREGFWKVEDDILIHYFASGQGKPVLFVHGGPGYPVKMPHMGFELLKDKMKTFYYHQRGCGNSTKPFDRFSSSNYFKNMKTLEQTLGMGAHIADIERIRKILKRERITIIGHSFGAFMATLYGSEFPNNVESLVLISPADMLHMPPKHGGLFENIRKELPENLKEEYDGYLKEYFDFRGIFKKSENQLRETLNNFFKYYAIAAEKKGIEIGPGQTLDGDNGGWMTYAVYFSLGRKHAFTDSVKEIEVPVLIIHGGKDFQSVDVSKDYDALFPNSKLKVIEEASHFAFDESPEEFADLLKEFLFE